VERTIHYVHRLRMHEMSMDLHKFRRGEESSEANVEQTSTVVESNGEIIDPSRYTYAKRAYQFNCPGYMYGDDCSDGEDKATCCCSRRRWSI
jgi:hypothetical protein